ncbi:MAG: hypothetical protein HUU50_02630 [Candidatus Brocadiae bacterium]|nr:hypothetical protein [Candidatus Brocadiia bacterium]
MNEDYCFVAVVISYDEAYGKILCRKIFDTEATKTFYVRALYFGQQGTPSTSEIEIGQNILVHRVGDGNNSFAALSETPQLHDIENSTNFSFVSFFFRSLIDFPISAFLSGNLEGSQDVLKVACARKLTNGETWKSTNLQLTRTFEIISNTNKDIKILTSDARQIIRLSSLSLGVYKNLNDSCEGTVSETNFFYRASLLACKIDGVDALACVDFSNLSIDIDCCGE